MKRFIYKVCTETEWSAARQIGHFEGSPDDRRDGFLHLSTAQQLETTLRKHFSGQTGLVLITFDATTLAPHLKWEPSRGGQLFPHLYGALPAAAALSETVLTLATDGRHILPEELR